MSAALQISDVISLLVSRRVSAAVYKSSISTRSISHYRALHQRSAFLLYHKLIVRCQCQGFDTVSREKSTQRLGLFCLHSSSANIFYMYAYYGGPEKNPDFTGTIIKVRYTFCLDQIVGIISLN
jgi:hypothetical protein